MNPTARAQVKDMKQYFGIMPGGGLITVLEFEADSFGVVGERAVQRLIAPITKERRAAFSEVSKMLKAFKFVHGAEQVISLSLGTDKLGHPTLMVVLLELHEVVVEEPPQQRAIGNDNLEQRDNTPCALDKGHEGLCQSYKEAPQNESLPNS